MQLEAVQELTLWISSERDQVDARIAKSLQIGRARIQGTLSLFNLFNANTSLTVNNRVSTTTLWPQPTPILQSRLVKVGAHVDF